MIPLEKVQDVVVKYDSLEKELSTGTIDSKTFAQKSKEYSDLGNIISYARSYLDFNGELKELEQILHDKGSDLEMKNLAEKELNILKQKKIDHTNKLKIFLLPKDEDDSKNAIVEIRAGTGGLEASLFCADLFKMYEKVCSKKKWKLEIFHGNLNKEFCENIVDGIDNVELHHIDYDYMGLHDYDSVFRTTEFWKTITSDNILIFQADTILLRTGIDEFLDYSYVGAPWLKPKEGKYVGNGGLSIRNKNRMIDIIKKYPNDDYFKEDIYFIKYLNNENISLDFKTEYYHILKVNHSNQL